MKNRTIWIALVVGSLALVAGFGATLASAKVTGNYPPIVQKLADRFHLNADDVNKVFDKDRQDHQKQMRADFKERLNQAVKDGKITAKQKTAILKKQDELAKEGDDRDELQSWAEKNDIDLETLRSLRLGFGGGRGPGGPGRPGGPGGPGGGPGFGRGGFSN
jgi:hypothetical protein